MCWVVRGSDDYLQAACRMCVEPNAKGVLLPSLALLRDQHAACHVVTFLPHSCNTVITHLHHHSTLMAAAGTLLLLSA